MFTLEQIKAAHANVKSGADFPQYIRDLIALGVVSYETWVTDGHTEYAGKDGHRLSSPAGYEALAISDTSNAGQFKSDLKAHQQGQTDYSSFCRDCAASGIEKWVVSTGSMTCTYFDKAGNNVLSEEIPR